MGEKFHRIEPKPTNNDDLVGKLERVRSACEESDDEKLEPTVRALGTMITSIRSMADNVVELYEQDLTVPSSVLAGVHSGAHRAKEALDTILDEKDGVRKVLVRLLTKDRKRKPGSVGGRSAGGGTHITRSSRGWG